MSLTAEVLLADEDDVRGLNFAFQLPWTPQAEKRVATLVDKANRASGTVDEGRVLPQMASNLETRSEELTAHSDRLRDASTALEGYVRGDHAIRLWREVASLHRRVRVLCDLNDSPRGATPVQVRIAAREVLEAGKVVASVTNDAVDGIRKELKDKALEAELERTQLNLQAQLGVENSVEEARRATEAGEKVKDSLESLGATVKRIDQGLPLLAEFLDMVAEDRMARSGEEQAGEEES